MSTLHLNESNSHPVYIVVVPERSMVEECVAGIYYTQVPIRFSLEQAAQVALANFHLSNDIGDLEDFCITPVCGVTGEVIEEIDHDCNDEQFEKLCTIQLVSEDWDLPKFAKQMRLGQSNDFDNMAGNDAPGCY